MTWANPCSLLTAGANVGISGTTNCTISTTAVAYSQATYTSNVATLTLPAVNGLTEWVAQTTPAPLTINLPSTGLISGFIMGIKDYGNDFALNHVTVKTTDGSQIDGVAGTTGYVMNSTRQASYFQYDGTGKWAIE